MTRKGLAKPDPYRNKNYPCATCGQPTSSRRPEFASGHGEWHHACRRDDKGHLIVWDETLKRERPA